MGILVVLWVPERPSQLTSGTEYGVSVTRRCDLSHARSHTGNQQIQLMLQTLLARQTCFHEKVSPMLVTGPSGLSEIAVARELPPFREPSAVQPDKPVSRERNPPYPLPRGPASSTPVETVTAQQLARDLQ